MSALTIRSSPVKSREAWLAWRAQIILLSIILLGLESCPVLAMDYAWHEDEGRVVVMASGDVQRDEATRFDDWRADHLRGRRIDAIVFDSAGGYIIGAWALAQDVHRLGVDTGIAHRGRCVSACVMPWAAGAHKTVPYDGAV